MRHARPWRPGRASDLWKLDLKEGGFSAGAVHEDQAAFNCEERLSEASDIQLALRVLLFYLVWDLSLWDGVIYIPLNSAV